MEKYITDAIRNSLRSVTGKLTRPQQKTVEELVRGLFTQGEPILTHLAQHPDVTAKKQAERYSYHLGNIDLTELVEALALRKTASAVRKNTVDPDVYLLIVRTHLEEREPIRLLTNLGWKEFSDQQMVMMYLKRWGIENIFRSAKVCFGLEKIRVQSFVKIRNLVALIHLVLVLSAHLFRAIQKSTHTLVVAMLHVYKLFLTKRSLTLNYDSFVRYLRQALPPLIHRSRPPPQQLPLFSWRQPQKVE